jgi:isocitrate lyase
VIVFVIYPTNFGLQLLSVVQRKRLDSGSIAKFQPERRAVGYKSQFVTLADFHALNSSSFNLGRGYRHRGMASPSEMQDAAFTGEADSHVAMKRQRELGTGYFDIVAQIIAGGESSPTVLPGSTEAEELS